jgi:hypothetical protein
MCNGEEYKDGSGKWYTYYFNQAARDNGNYTQEVLADGTLVLTMLSQGFNDAWGDSTYDMEPRICFQDVNGDGSALTEAPDLIITVDEPIEWGPSEEENSKGRWVNTHVKYRRNSSDLILDNLADCQGYASIPSYWESEMINTIEKVNSLKKAAGNNAISFAWCSDAHVILNTTAEGDTSHLGKLMYKAIKDTNTPLAISTGDEQSGASLATKELLMENFAEMKRHFAPLWGKPEFIALLGNHDGTFGEADESGLYYQRQLPPEEMFYEYFSNAENKPELVKYLAEYCSDKLDLHGDTSSIITDENAILFNKTDLYHFLMMTSFDHLADIQNAYRMLFDSEIARCPFDSQEQIMLQVMKWLYHNDNINL